MKESISNIKNVQCPLQKSMEIVLREISEHSVVSP
jgi:hypothetical protein